MKIVAVTACPIGIAHTYMASTALSNICKEKGIEIKVEMQGQLGPENVISESEIAEADAIIFANAISIINEERFKPFEEKIIRIKPEKILRSPEVVINELIARGLFKE